MELGNLTFGNSRGRYYIHRGVGFEEELFRLFDAYAPDRDNSWREYGVPFENKTFIVRDYYWGECDCGFDNHDFKENHSDNCYQKKLIKRKIEAGWHDDALLSSPKKWSWDEAEKRERKIMKKLCKEEGIDWNNGLGCAVHCSCDYDKRYEKWLEKIGYPDGHKESCSLVLPNFHYKPDDFKISWYKYPLRDSYSNQPIELEKFKEIINQCIKSLK